MGQLGGGTWSQEWMFVNIEMHRVWVLMQMT